MTTKCLEGRRPAQTDPIEAVEQRGRSWSSSSPLSGLQTHQPLTYKLTGSRLDPGRSGT
jgi:hypothetical protein